MTEQPKTIQIFLPDGNARSIRIATVTTRLIQATQVPRRKLKAVGGRKEIHQVGVYFLFGEEEDSAKPAVYIGEAKDCYKRLRQHGQQKDFWNTAVVITSKIQSFNKAQVRYLEWYFLQKARQVGRYDIENSGTASEPHLSEPVKADLSEHICTIRLLLSTLGFPLLEDPAASEAESKPYFCGEDGIEAEGRYTDDGFVVLKGSKACLEEIEDKGPWVTRRRDALRENGILAEEDGALVFTEDHLFNSPSAAAQTVLARPANGWKQWYTREGRTLDEVERID